jgi:hypothetical protein
VLSWAPLWWLTVMDALRRSLVCLLATLGTLLCFAGLEFAALCLLAVLGRCAVLPWTLAYSPAMLGSTMLCLLATLCFDAMCLLVTLCSLHWSCAGLWCTYSLCSLATLLYAALARSLI